MHRIYSEGFVTDHIALVVDSNTKNLTVGDIEYRERQEEF